MKKFGKNGELVIEKYKVLGDGELTEKIIIRARGFTQSAKEKIEKAGGKAISLSVKKEEKEKPSSVSKKTEDSRKPSSLSKNNEEYAVEEVKPIAKVKVVKPKK